MLEPAHSNSATCRVKLVFADDGSFHDITVELPAERLAQYDRLVDLLREEPSVTRQLYIDMRRLVTASLLEEQAEPGEIGR
jgi:hypothetical protein